MKTPFARRIGMNICKLRSDRDWSQLELAGRINVDLSTVQRWESGCVVPCGFDLFKLSVALGVSTDAIYHGLPRAIAKLDELHPRKLAHHAVQS